MDSRDLKYYDGYVGVLINKQEMILAEIHKILDQMTDDSEYAPVEHIRSRIKSSSSIRQKLKRNGYSDDAKSGLKHLSDVIGVRIVTHFIGDAYSILQSLKASHCWEVIRVKDYISHPKPNGYRSLHIILQVPVEGLEFPFISAEIQIRTIAMDCWASLEHQMRYKKKIKNVDLIVEELKRCADEMASTDLSLQTIRETIQIQ